MRFVRWLTKDRFSALDCLIVGVNLTALNSLGWGEFGLVFVTTVIIALVLEYLGEGGRIKTHKP